MIGLPGCVAFFCGMNLGKRRLPMNRLRALDEGREKMVGKPAVDQVNGEMRPLSLASLWAVLCLVGCAGSSSHLLAPAGPAIRPDQVKVYRVAPKHYQQIATLDATSGGRFFHGDERSDAEVIERLKEEAAKVGANGVLLSLVGDEASGSIGIGLGGGGYASRGSGFNGAASGSAPLVQTAAHGLAIYVPNRR